MLFLLLACAPATITVDKDAPTDTAVDSAGGDSADNGGNGGDSDSGGANGGQNGGENGASNGGGGDTGDTATVPVEGFVLTLDDAMVTLIHAAWTDPGASDSWVEYRFDGGPWVEAPAVAPGVASVLGVPSETKVEARAVAVVGGQTRMSPSASITTGTLPRDLPLPTIDVYDPTLAYDAPWVMISVDGGDYTYSPPYWIEIFDREGRVVWYQKTPNDMMTFYATPAHDGTHIWWEGDNIFGMGSADPYVVRQTLDGRWVQQQDVPGMGQAIAEGPADQFYYELRSGRSGHGLNRLDPDGTATTVWDCGAWVSEHGLRSSDCYMNTCNWSESHNSVLASMFEANTVFEIDLDTQEPIRQMGQITEGDPYAFSPADSVFDYQHNVYWTAADTLMASTHIRGRSGVQVAAEYSVDDDTKTLTRIWEYVSTDMWATQVGEAVRLPNGNTMQGYGQDGGAREVTMDGDIAWQATWEKDAQGYRVVGHLSLIEDLYALNVGR